MHPVYRMKPCMLAFISSCCFLSSVWAGYAVSASGSEEVGCLGPCPETMNPSIFNGSGWQQLAKAKWRVGPSASLSRDIVEAALSPWGYTGKRCPICRALVRAQREGHLDIVVLGGSFPFGVSLSKGQYPWPKLLTEDLRTLGWPGKVQVHNMAKPGVPSVAQEALLHNMHAVLEAAHIVIVDIASNDQPGHQQIVKTSDPARVSSGAGMMDVLHGYISSRDSAVLYFENFAEGALSHPSHTPDELKSPFAADYKMHTFLPHCPFDTASLFHWPALVARGLPVLSYADAACRVSVSKISHDKALWNISLHNKEHLPHPPALTHVFMSRLVAASLMHIAETSCTRSESGVSAQQLCSTFANQIWLDYLSRLSWVRQTSADEEKCAVSPVSYMDADDPRGFKPTSAGTNWFFGEDVPGKPGWIMDKASCSNTTYNHLNSTSPCQISFNVTTGSSSRVDLVILRSYSANMGFLRCTVDCTTDHHCEQSFLVESRWQSHTSQADLISFPVKPLAGVQHEHVLKCVAISGKSKIIAIRGC